MVNRRKDLAGVTLGMVTSSGSRSCFTRRSRQAAGRRAEFQFLGCSDSLAGLRSEAYWAVSTQLTLTQR
jgi:hypothetical protein